MRGPLFAIVIGLALGLPGHVFAQAEKSGETISQEEFEARLNRLQADQSKAQQAYNKARAAANVRAEKRNDADKDKSADPKEPAKPEEKSQPGQPVAPRPVPPPGDAEAFADQKAAWEARTTAVRKNATAAFALVDASPKDPLAFSALEFAMNISRDGVPDICDVAMRRIAKDYADAPKLGAVCRTMYSYTHVPAAEELLRAVAEKHPNKEDKGHALYSLAYYLQSQSRLVRQLTAGNKMSQKLAQAYGPEVAGYLSRKDPKALDQQAEVLLDRLVKDFADVEIGTAKKRSLADVATGQLFGLRNLKVGQPIPDLVGKDHEGKEFKLSDFKGKVLVLTFSGDWCPPCRGMYPHQRELVKRLKDKPFALLSVNTDPKLETLANSIKDGTITWRCWFDGSRSGPLCSAWGVTSFPTLFVIDHAGIIRVKDVRDEELDEAVDELMGKLPKTAATE